jgi:hypothetical protein
VKLVNIILQSSIIRNLMLDYYYLDKHPKKNGDIEVHHQSCNHLPNYKNRILIGILNNGIDAVRQAKEQFSTAIGCSFCCDKCRHSEEDKA